MAGYELASVSTDIAYTGLFAGHVFIEKSNITVADNQTLALGTVMGVGGIPMTYNDYPQTAPVAIVATNATNLFTLAGHTLIDGDIVEITGTATATGITLNTKYYIVTATTNTFQLAATPGGAAIALSGDGTALKIWREARESDKFIGVLLKAVTTSGATADVAVALTGSFNESALTFGGTITAANVKLILRTYSAFINSVTAEI